MNIRALLCLVLFAIIFTTTLIASNLQLTGEPILDQQINKGIVNADLYNQMGISLYKQGYKGYAVLYFLRALRLNSNHSEARNNLEYAISQSPDREMYTPPSFLAVSFQKVFNFFTLNALTLLLILTLLLTVLCVHWLLHLPLGGDKAVPVMWLVIIGLVFLLNLTLVTLKYNGHRDSSQAVVIASELDGYSGPGQEFGKLFTLHAGLIIHLNRVDKDWALITLPNGGAGWIQFSALERVRK